MRSGYLVSSSTSVGSSNIPLVADTAGNISLAGDWVDVPWLSFARCALIDNRPNLLLQSDVFGTSWTPSNATVGTNATAAPDGTTTADSIIEDSTASTSHGIYQAVTVSSAAADYTFTVCLKASGRTWAMVRLYETTGATQVDAYVNLSTGAIGTTATGANWSDLRAFSTSLGDGWYRVAIVGRKTNAATTLRGYVYLATADNTPIYNGNGSGNIHAWRGGLAQSSVPFNPMQTTTAADADGALQTGSGLYIKGLPASTSGLLLAGDQVQIGDELLFVAAPLDSTAGGLGYLQLHRPLRTPAADNAPVIVHEPMGKFLLAQSENGWINSAPAFTDSTLDFIEAVS